jgi:hypothetical protein
MFQLEIGHSKRNGKRYQRYCSLRCAKTGTGNPRWKGDALTSPTAGRKRACRAYKIGPCDRCNAPGRDRHHKDENTLNNNPSNVVILCRRCHMELDGRLAAFIKMAKRPKRRPAHQRSNPDLFGEEG